jgi:hypothetical protein
MIIKIGKEEVNLDKDILKFSPETINDFLSNYASLTSHYHDKYADAAYIASKYKDSYNNLLNLKFKNYKTENNYSDKMAEACAKSDAEVVAVQEKMRAAEYVKDLVYGFLRSMDDAHTDAKEMCYNLRKELDKIYPKHVRDNRVDAKLEEIFGQ